MNLGHLPIVYQYLRGHSPPHSDESCSWLYAKLVKYENVSLLKQRLSCAYKVEIPTQSICKVLRTEPVKMIASHAVILTLAGLLAGSAADTVHGIVVFTRHADRT